MTPGSEDAGRPPDLVEIERPGPEPPSVGDDPGEAVDLEADDDVDEVLLRTFWGAVIAINVAMAAIPLGLLLIYFRGDRVLDGQCEAAEHPVAPKVDQEEAERDGGHRDVDGDDRPPER